MVSQKLGFITVAICFGYITTLTGLKVVNFFYEKSAHPDKILATPMVVTRQQQSYNAAVSTKMFLV